MITVTVRKTGLLRRAWRLKIVAENGEPLPDDYVTVGNAIRGAELMFGPSEPVQLVVIHPNGAPAVTRQLR